MAEGLLKSFDKELEVYSAGTRPEKAVNPNAVSVMNEIGIDISSQYPKLADNFINDSFDYVITVCDNAKKNCPVFTGKVNHRLHIGFDDPAFAKGTSEEVLNVYRLVRDEIKNAFTECYNTEIS